MNTSAEWLPISAIAARLGVEDREVARTLVEIDLVESRAHSRVDDGVRVYSPALVKLIARVVTLRSDGGRCEWCEIDYRQGNTCPGCKAGLVRSA